MYPASLERYSYNIHHDSYMKMAAYADRHFIACLQKPTSSRTDVVSTSGIWPSICQLIGLSTVLSPQTFSSLWVTDRGIRVVLEILVSLLSVAASTLIKLSLWFSCVFVTIPRLEIQSSCSLKFLSSWIPYLYWILTRTPKTTSDMSIEL